MVQQLLEGQCLPLFEDSRSHPDTPHLVGHLWTREQPDAHNVHKTDIHAPDEIRTRNSRKPAATGVRKFFLHNRIRSLLQDKTAYQPNLFVNGCTSVSGYKRSEFCLRSHIRCHFLNSVIRLVIVIVTCVLHVKYELNFSFLFNNHPCASETNL